VIVKVYFDTNIYRFITERDEIHRVAMQLNQSGCRLLASAGNLLETYAIKSLTIRSQELEAIIRLGNQFQDHPESYLHALEVRREIKRLRPRWINIAPRRKKERFYLKNHLALWVQARARVLPSATAFAAYSRDAEQGIASIQETQKDLRTSLHTAPSDFQLLTPDGQTFSVNLDDPELYWRVEGLLAWHHAIVKRASASRDYADWLEPYLRPNSFSDPSYPDFWLREVSAAAMPLNRLTGLVSFYQLKQKITHGNAADQIHASCWLESDLFITADRGFYEALAAAAQHYPHRPLPILVDRAAPSFASQLEKILAA